MIKKAELNVDSTQQVSNYLEIMNFADAILCLFLVKSMK